MKPPMIIAAATLIATIAATARAADVTVNYLLDSKELKKNAVAGTALVIDLYGDDACTSAIDSAGVDIEDIDLVESLKTIKIKDAPKLPKIGRLVHVLSGVADGASHAEISGTGIVAVGGDCQKLIDSSPGATTYASVLAFSVTTGQVAAADVGAAWIDSVSSSATGEYDLTFSSGTFSASPACTVSFFDTTFPASAAEKDGETNILTSASGATVYISGSDGAAKDLLLSDKAYLICVGE